MLLAFLSEPVVKGEAAAGEAGQEVAFVEGNGRIQLPRRQSRQKISHIQAMVAGHVKLDGGVGDEQKWLTLSICLS